MSTKNYGELGRASGLQFEEKLKVKHSCTYPIDQKDIWGEKITKSKADLLNGSNRFSVKNPKSENTSIQVQVCSANRFNRLFNPPENVKIALNQFVGNHSKLLTIEGYKRNPKALQEACADWNISTINLSNTQELNRGRLLTNNIASISDLIDWLNNNVEEIYRFVLSTSFNNPSNTNVIANKIWWARKKNDENSVVEFDIEEIITKAKNNATVSVRDSKSVICIGPITLQMKGSGKGAAYHNMQFNLSLKDLENFMNKE